MNSRPASYPRPLPNDLPGFEVEAAVARMMDNAELWWRALAIFQVHFGDWKNAWLLSQAERDAERKCVHALRSGAVNVGAVQLAAAAAALENALTAQTISHRHLAPLRTTLLDRYDEARRSAASVLTDTQSSTKPAP